MLPAVKQLFARTLPRLYTPRVKRTSKRLGLHGFFVGLYLALLRGFTSLGYRFSADTETMAVRDVRAEFHVDNPTEYDRVTTLIGERAVLEAFVDAIRPDDVVWDVGANVGSYAVVGGLVATDGEVVAFEPHPENAHRIAENASLNGLENLRVEQVALSDEDGTARLHIHGDETGGGQHSLVDEGEDAVAVDLARGDDVEGATPNVVKVDVEGAELDVLDGMRETLADPACRVLLIEVHHSHDVSNEAVEDRLHAAGFETAAIEARGSTTFLRATKPDGTAPDAADSAA